MSFDLYYKKNTKELIVLYKDTERDVVCFISIERHPTAKQRIVGVDDWKQVLPEFRPFSFNRAYSCFRDRTISDSSDEYEYTYHKSVLDRFFHDSLDQTEVSLLDRYNINLFLILLYIRKATINTLIENNPALALMLIHDSCNSSLPFESDELWANIRETAQLMPSQIVKNLYNIKTSRKASEIFQKVDTKELPCIEPLLQLIESLRDCWVMGILENLNRISYEVLLIIIERKNRSVISAGFLTSVNASSGSPVSASHMLQWLHENHVTIHFPLTNMRHLRTIYEHIVKEEDLPDVVDEFNSGPLITCQSDPGPQNDSVKERDPILEVPHRMEKASDILLAMQHDILGLGKKTYQKLLDLEKDIPVIDRPAAVLKAVSVTKEFFLLKERKITHLLETYDQSKAFNSIGNSELINEQFPELERLIDPEFLSEYVASADSDNYSRRLRGHARALNRHRLLHEIIMDEIRAVIKCSQAKSMTIKELKRVIAATALHDYRNKDVLQALKLAMEMNNPILRGNAVAELLFTRIPAYIRSHFTDDPKVIVSLRQRLLSKISKVKGPPNLKIALFHLAPRSNTRKKDDFIAMMNRLLSFIEKTEIVDEESKISVRSFIQNVTGEIRRLDSIYKKLFLTEKELQDVYGLYRPNNRLVTCNMQHIERIIYEHCDIQKLYMYPCKDYLDLEKYRWSHDCSKDTLGVNQLRTPQFFNVRLFKNDKEYCGNIYMLQMECDSRIYLLVDRIQTASFDTRYVMFYDTLKDAFQKMFRDLSFNEILLPDINVSNNASLNKLFHDSKKKYIKKKVSFDLHDDMRRNFECLRSDSFHVLYSKTS